MNSMPRFYVWNMPGMSLLVPARSGIVYANQTGGHHCYQQEVEGHLLPLFNTFEGLEQDRMLGELFTGPKWSGWCGEGIDSETADFVDRILKMTPHTDWLAVDRTRLVDSHEAWVYVLPKEHRNTETIEFRDFRFECGILTWQNSD